MYLVGGVVVDTVVSAFVVSVLLMLVLQLLLDVGEAVKSSENVDATVGAGDASFV